MHKPKKIFLSSLFIALALGTWGYLNIEKSNQEHEVKIVAGTIGGTEVVSTDGSIQHLTLGFLVGGRIKSVSVHVGDIVKAGDILATLDAGNAEGALTQAKAAYALAEANYQKVINGATGASIDVAKAAVNTAQINLDQAKTQQDLLVANAYANLLNSTPQALPASGANDSSAPVISGNYTLGKEGNININIFPTGEPTFSVSGLTTGSGTVSTGTPQKLGNSGLYIKFPSTTNISTLEWTISIPNKQAPNYLAN